MSYFRPACEICHDPEGWRGFHRADCPRGVEWEAERLVKAERLMREIDAGYAGPFVMMRDAAARAKEPRWQRFYAAVRDLVAVMKGDKAVGEEIERESAVKCLRCVADPDVDVTERHEFAHEFARWIEDSGLKPGTEALMEMTTNHKGSPYYRMGWADRDGEIGGEVHVYSDCWVHVTWHGGNDGVPVRGHAVFESDFAAQAFLGALSDHDWKAAQRVPQKATS